MHTTLSMENHSTEATKGNILVVDDTLANVQLLSRMLTEQGYKVRKVLNGPMALMGVQTAPPDLILLDVNMPDMNGYEVCQLLKADQSTQGIPIIFISALNEVTEKVKAFSVGGVDYITKPFQLAEVLARIEHQLMLQELQRQLQKQNFLLQKKIQEHELALQELELAKAALQQANQELSRLAIIDDLTQVANRRHFYDYLSQVWQQSLQAHSSLSLLLCDVDHFKAYNDAYGHQKGDHCLRQVARAIQQTICRSTDLVARYGGEEFAVILFDTTAALAMNLASEMQNNLQTLQLAHPKSMVDAFVTLSIGVATTIPHPDHSPELLIAIADQALYSAKEQGRNRVITEIC